MIHFTHPERVICIRGWTIRQVNVQTNSFAGIIELSVKSSLWKSIIVISI